MGAIWSAATLVCILTCCGPVTQVVPGGFLRETSLLLLSRLKKSLKLWATLERAALVGFVWGTGLQSSGLQSWVETPATPRDVSCESGLFADVL